MESKTICKPPSQASHAAQEGAWTRVYKCGPWHWVGKCNCCQLRYGYGMPDGEYMRSYPKVGGVPAMEKEVLAMLEEVGAAGALVMLEAGPSLPFWGSKSELSFSILAQRPASCCPRCRGWLKWCVDHEDALLEQLKNTATNIVLRQPVPNTWEDLLITCRVWQLVTLLQERGRAEPAVAVVAKTRVAAYMLWRVLRTTQSVWCPKEGGAVPRNSEAVLAKLLADVPDFDPEETAAYLLPDSLRSDHEEVDRIRQGYAARTFCVYIIDASAGNDVYFLSDVRFDLLVLFSENVEAPSCLASCGEKVWITEAPREELQHNSSWNAESGDLWENSASGNSLGNSNSSASIGDRAAAVGSRLWGKAVGPQLRRKAIARRRAEEIAPPVGSTSSALQAAGDDRSGGSWLTTSQERHRSSWSSADGDPGSEWSNWHSAAWPPAATAVACELQQAGADEHAAWDSGWQNQDWCTSPLRGDAAASAPHATMRTASPAIDFASSLHSAAGVSEENETIMIRVLMQQEPHDSFTQIGGVSDAFRVTSDEDQGCFRASVRLPLLHHHAENIRSDWCPTKDEAMKMAASKACRILRDDIAESCAERDGGVWAGDQPDTSVASKFVPPMGLDTTQAVVECEASCNRDIACNGIQVGGEAERSPFKFLHKLDLLEAEGLQWPDRMFLWCIDVFPPQDGGASYGLLTVPPLEDDAGSLRRGERFEFAAGAGTAECGAAQLHGNYLTWPPADSEFELTFTSEERRKQVRAFHTQMLPDLFPTPHVPADVALLGGPTPALLVRIGISGTSVDWDAMRTASSSDRQSLPLYLAPLLRQWLRLYDLQVVALRYGPSFPVLAPLDLEAALSSGLSDLGHQGLRLVGGAALESLMVLANLALGPTICAADFEQQLLRNAPRADLATCFRWSPAAKLVDHRIDDEQCAGVFEALLGACFVSVAGGGFFAVWRMLRWLVVSSKVDKGCLAVFGDEASVEVVESVLGHYFFGKNGPYKGRTPSFVHLMEVRDGDNGARIIRVKYKDALYEGWVEYRWAPSADCFPGGFEERVNKGDFTPLKYNKEMGTFVSPQMTEMAENAKDPLAPSIPYEVAIPNKVVSSLLGILLPSQCAIKFNQGKAKDRHAEQRGAEIVLLQERRGQQLHEGELWVRYKTHGWIGCFRTRDGSFGFEREILSVGEVEVDFGRRKPIFWSEDLKTMMSSITELAVPPKVVEWLRLKALPLLLPQQKCFNVDVCEKGSIDILHGRKVVWTYDKREFTYFCDRTVGGCNFLEREEGGIQEGLLYSVEYHLWLSPALLRSRPLWMDDPVNEEMAKNVCVPEAVMDPLRKWAREESRSWSIHAPWCPKSANSSDIPPGLDIELVEGILLKYHFKTATLLVEALTHESYTTAETPPYCRLATLGQVLVEALIAERLALRARDDVCINKRNIDGSVEDNYELVEPATLIRGKKHWQDMVGACCNHVVYAYACVRIGLHRHILHFVPELMEAMKSFACFVRHTRRSKSDFAPYDLMPDLIKRDAPMVLGDVFLATAAALFLDSNYKQLQDTFGDMVEEHILSIAQTNPGTGSLTPRLTSEQAIAHVDVRRLDPESLGPVEAYKIATDAVNNKDRQVFQASAFKRPPPPPPPEDMPVARRCCVASSLKDFHVFQASVEGEDVGPPILGTSPRSSLRRCAHLAACRLDLPSDGRVEDFPSIACMTVEVDSDDGASNEMEAAEAGPTTEGDDGSVWCKDCEKWLNGSTQMNQHKIGKEHKKNVRRIKKAEPSSSCNKVDWTV